MALTPQVVDQIRRYDALIRKLQDYGLPPHDSKGYIAAFMAKKQQMADQYAEEQRALQKNPFFAWALAGLTAMRHPRKISSGQRMSFDTASSSQQ